jgi:hypothetical protein
LFSPTCIAVSSQLFSNLVALDRLSGISAMRLRARPSGLNLDNAEKEEEEVIKVLRDNEQDCFACLKLHAFPYM